MVKDNFTAIAMVIDRSGSMSGKEDDVIGGFNTFIQAQKKVPGKAIFTLVQFDDQYEVMYDGVDIQEVKELDRTTYVPRNSTALLDAVGRTISTLGSKLASMGENDRPSKVVVVITTDGFENASREHTRQDKGNGRTSN